MSATSAWLTLSRASRSFQKGTSEEQQRRGGMHATDMELRNHLKNKCQQCGKSFTRKGDMTRHKARVHMNERNHACDICEKRFGSKGDMTRHKAMVHMNVKNHACDICGKRFGSKAHMTRHKKEIHFKDPSKNKCQQCGMSFAGSDHLKRHQMLVHMNERNYACDICEERFGEIAHMTRHKEQVHMNERNHACDICGKRFGTKETMTRHRESGKPCRPQATDMELRNPLKNKCKQCGKTFTRNTYLKRHQKSVHMNERNHACDICELRFGSKDHMTRHKEQVHMKERTHACDICGKRFGRKEHIAGHRESVHEVHFETKRGSHLPPDLPSSIEVATKDSNPLIDGVEGDQLQGKVKYNVVNKCHQCGRSFTGSDHLKRHQMLKHMNERKHACDICGNSFTRNALLKRHQMLVHEIDERTYACDICGQIFGAKRDMKRHREVAHFRCRHCGETFKDKKEYERDLRNCKRNKLSGPRKIRKRSNGELSPDVDARWKCVGTNPNCKNHCATVQPYNNFTKKLLKIPFHATCTDDFVVYQIRCRRGRRCKAQYFGMTTRPSYARTKEHIDTFCGPNKGLEEGDKKRKLIKHFLECGKENMEWSVVDKGVCCCDLEMIEASYE